MHASARIGDVVNTAPNDSAHDAGLIIKINAAMTDKKSVDLADDVLLETIELPARVRNALSWAGIKTVGEARQTSDKTLRSLENIGPRSVAYIRQKFGEAL